VTDRDAQVLDLLARLLRKEVEEAARDAVGRLGGSSATPSIETPRTSLPLASLSRFFSDIGI